MHNHIRLFLQTRIRLATAEGAHERPLESPLSQQPHYVPSPFLLSSLPTSAADILAADEPPNKSIGLVWTRPATQATYVLHVVQAGHLQLRTVLPTSNESVRALLEHAVGHESLNLVFDIEGTTQGLDLLTVLDRETASVALAAPQVQTSDAVQEDEAELLLSLAREPEVPSLVPGCEVFETLVVFGGGAVRIRLNRLRELADFPASTKNPLH